MKQKIISAVKYNGKILKLYRTIGNLGARILKLLIPKNNRLILFMSFGGKKYDDSPKAIYEYMLKDDFFKNYKIVWAFIEPHKHPEVTCKKIKTDSFVFYVNAIAAKYWIHNSSMERGLQLKKCKTFEFNTNHGTPIKYWGIDASNAPYSSKSSDAENIRYCSQSEYDRDIFAHCLNASVNQFIMSGLPRNDSLYLYTEKEIRDIKNRLGIPSNKKVILYAPTFRENERDRYNRCCFTPPINKDKWNCLLKNEFVVLVRAHYEIANTMNFKTNEIFIDVSDYPYINDLYIISDYLISDYSSVYFDYSILDRPMFCYAYDYEQYSRTRGLYLDLEKELPCRVNVKEDALLDDILNCDLDKAIEKTRLFHHKYATFSGEATKNVVAFIKAAMINDSW